MRDFFDEQGRTRVFARGVLEVRRGRKPAENAAHRKNSHLWMETSWFISICFKYIDFYSIVNSQYIYSFILFKLNVLC